MKNLKENEKEMKTLEDIIEHIPVMTVEELILLGLNIFEELNKRKDNFKRYDIKDYNRFYYDI